MKIMLLIEGVGKNGDLVYFIIIVILFLKRETTQQHKDDS